MIKQILIVTGLIAGASAFPISAGAFDQNGFHLEVGRLIDSPTNDMDFNWRVRPPFHYDVFNVRVRVSDGRKESQVERPGGTVGHFVVRNGEFGLTYTLLVQGCDKRTFGSSKCTPWSQIRFTYTPGNDAFKGP
jgi:hypothetical protein